MLRPTFTRDILLAALAGFQLDKQRIDLQIAEVQALLDGGGTRKAVRSASEEISQKGRRKKFSAAARRKMALAQKARWAKIKGDNQSESAPTEPVKAKRKLSVAGRKAIQESMRRRWALKKAEAAKPTPARKATPKKSATKKKAAPAKAATKKVAPVKKTAVKKAATKKTATVPAQAVAEVAGQ